MKLHFPRAALWVLGSVSVIPYLFAVWLQDLRTHTKEFLIIYCIAFLLYAGASMLALSLLTISSRELGAIFAVAIIAVCGRW